MILLVVILLAGCLVSAGSIMFLLVVILPVGYFISAGSTLILLYHVSAGCFISAGSNLFLLSQLGFCLILLVGWSLPLVTSFLLVVSNHADVTMYLLNESFVLLICSFCCSESDLWRDVNMLCQSLHSDDVEDFLRTQDEWVVSSWKLYPNSSIHVLDLTNGKTVYMFVDKFYPIRATLLERMLRHRLTVPPSYCRDVVVAGSVIQMVQTGLQQSYECLASAPLSPWLTAKKESGSPLQTALVCFSNPLIALASPEQTTTDWMLLIQDVAASFDSAVHRVHAVSFDAAAYFVRF
ncbi:hypothetical protein Tco_1305052 [Tanacetum coccineum]